MYLFVPWAMIMLNLLVFFLVSLGFGDKLVSKEVSLRHDKKQVNTGAEKIKKNPSTFRQRFAHKRPITLRVARVIDSGAEKRRLTQKEAHNNATRDLLKHKRQNDVAGSGPFLSGMGGQMGPSIPARDSSAVPVSGGFLPGSSASVTLAAATTASSSTVVPAGSAVAAVPPVMPAPSTFATVSSMLSATSASGFSGGGLSGSVPSTGPSSDATHSSFVVYSPPAIFSDPVISPAPSTPDTDSGSTGISSGSDGGGVASSEEESAFPSSEDESSDPEFEGPSRAGGDAVLSVSFMLPVGSGANPGHPEALSVTRMVGDSRALDEENPWANVSPQPRGPEESPRVVGWDTLLLTPGVHGQLGPSETPPAQDLEASHQDDRSMASGRSERGSPSAYARFPDPENLEGSDSAFLRTEALGSDAQSSPAGTPDRAPIQISSDDSWVESIEGVVPLSPAQNTSVIMTHADALPENSVTGNCLSPTSPQRSDAPKFYPTTPKFDSEQSSAEPSPQNRDASPPAINPPSPTPSVISYGILDVIGAGMGGGVHGESTDKTAQTGSRGRKPQENAVKKLHKAPDWIGQTFLGAIPEESEDSRSFSSASGDSPVSKLSQGSKTSQTRSGKKSAVRNLTPVLEQEPSTVPVFERGGVLARQVQKVTQSLPQNNQARGSRRFRQQNSAGPSSPNRGGKLLNSASDKAPFDTIQPPLQDAFPVSKGNGMLARQVQTVTKALPKTHGFLPNSEDGKSVFNTSMISFNVQGFSTPADANRVSRRKKSQRPQLPTYKRTDRFAGTVRKKEVLSISQYPHSEESDDDALQPAHPLSITGYIDGDQGNNMRGKTKTTGVLGYPLSQVSSLQESFKEPVSPPSSQGTRSGRSPDRTQPNQGKSSRRSPLKSLNHRLPAVGSLSGKNVSPSKRFLESNRRRGDNTRRVSSKTSQGSGVRMNRAAELRQGVHGKESLGKEYPAVVQQLRSCFKKGSNDAKKAIAYVKKVAAAGKAWVSDEKKQSRSGVSGPLRRQVSTSDARNPRLGIPLNSGKQNDLRSTGVRSSGSANCDAKNKGTTPEGRRVHAKENTPAESARAKARWKWAIGTVLDQSPAKRAAFRQIPMSRSERESSNFCENGGISSDALY